VFDNVDEADINPYWPSTAHGSIIITTQRKSMAHKTASEIALEVFDEEEGSELIINLIDPRHQNTSLQNLTYAKAISNELGGLPLLLSHVAGFIDGSQCPLPDLLRSLQQPAEFKKIWAFDSTTSTNFQYSEPMTKVWGLALRALKPKALVTLQIMAMLNPDGIAEDLLVGEWNIPGLEFLSQSRRFEQVSPNC
jgi:hypothetical protein